MDKKSTLRNIYASADPLRQQRISLSILNGLFTRFDLDELDGPRVRQQLTTALAAYHGDPNAHFHMIAPRSSNKEIYKLYKGKKFARMDLIEQKDPKKKKSKGDNRHSQ